jgi:hypothetical protein
MATTSKRLFGPAQLTNAAATLYTAPAATVAVARRLRVSNPTVNPITFTLSIGADAAGTRLFDNVPVPPCGSLDIYGPFTLAATQLFQGFASVNAALVLEIDGTETA